MRIHKLHIENFRKLQNVDIDMRETTFLIGANNAGKTSTLDAIEYLLCSKTFSESERSKFVVDNEEHNVEGETIISAEFRDVSEDVLNTRGFNRERLSTYEENGETKFCFSYRVRFDSACKPHREILLRNARLNELYSECNTLQEIIDTDQNIDSQMFAGENLTKKLTSKEKADLVNKFWFLGESVEGEDWVENPGGIPQNILSRLPLFLKIKADVAGDEMGETKGTLFTLLTKMFNEVREKSDHFKAAQRELEALQHQMDPSVEDSDFGVLIKEINEAISVVFPKSRIDVSTDLTKADSLKPSYDVSLKSNVSTKVGFQGTGLIRSAVVALLRYDQQQKLKNPNETHMGMIVGFEEPELFLHPNAAENMRNLIYELSTSDCQIISTTHSPYMIDLSKKPTQVLNCFSVGQNEFAQITPFNLSDAFLNIEADERAHVKMVQKIDDYVSRVFFARKSIVVEGDTEDIVFKKTISLMPEEVRKQIQSDYQIVMAHGKATMISFVKYLKALNVDVFVVHDEDSGVEGAEKMNQPILDSLDGDANKRLMMHNCVEEELGYNAPSYDKPYKAYEFVSQWEKWDDVPERWKEVIKKVFHEFAEQL